MEHIQNENIVSIENEMELNWFEKPCGCRSCHNCKKKFEEEVNDKIRGLVGIHLTKKRLNVLGIIIFSFFVVEMFGQKMMCNT
jgi:uncharacterized protein (UPF0212 family)